MTKQSVAAVVILSLITFGIYGIIWFVRTKDEMVQQGAEIPTGWLLIVPNGNIYWMWKWSGGVDRLTGGKTSQAVAFLLILLLGIIGIAIMQSTFNEIADRGAAGRLPAPA